MASPEDPQFIDFTSQTLGVEATLRINRPAMQILTPEERDLLGKVVKAYSLALSLAMELKPDMDKSGNQWSNYLEGMVQETHDLVVDLEGEVTGGNSLSSRMLGIDISIPPASPAA